MTEHLQLLKQIETWVAEAIEKYGDDWDSASIYLADKLRGVPEDKRAVIAGLLESGYKRLND